MSADITVMVLLSLIFASITKREWRSTRVMIQQGMLLVAERDTPQAVGFASALNISAFNLGIFCGENIGSVLVHHNNLEYTPLAGAGMCMLALLPLWFLVRYIGCQATK